MPIKHILTRGIGFSPGSIKYIPTLGLTPGVLAITAQRTAVVGPFKRTVVGSDTFDVIVTRTTGSDVVFTDPDDVHITVEGPR